MQTPRLEIRLPTEADRGRFVQLFGDESFMVFSDGGLDAEGANRRFDQMLARAEELPFAKQPVIELASGLVIGYMGVDFFDFEGQRRLEFGYRLVQEARGRGFATEAGRAVLDAASRTFQGEILAMINPRNQASRRVASKLGFQFWKQAMVDGHLVDLNRIWIS
jgi:RimJ/RimL family protein N-acetyltransferase